MARGLSIDRSGQSGSSQEPQHREVSDKIAPQPKTNQKQESSDHSDRSVIDQEWIQRQDQLNCKQG
jgi:hypothetical protein